MKRILSIVLILILSLSVLVACGGKEEPKVYDLENAKEYLLEQCSNLVPTTDIPVRSTISSFRVTKVLPCADGNYTVSWTSNNDAVKVVDYIPTDDSDIFSASNSSTIDLTMGDNEIPYTLTATITAPDGNSTTAQFNLKVPKLDPISHADYMQAESGTEVTVKGIVVAMNSVKLGNKYNHLFLADETVQGGYYCYKLDVDPGEMGVKVGMTVAVLGSMSPYDGMQEIKGGQVAIIDRTIKPVETLDVTTKFAAGENLSQYVGLPVTIKGVELSTQVLDVETSQYLYFSLGEHKSYIRTYVTDFPAGMLSSDDKATIDSDHKNHFGYKADVTGILVFFSKSPYLIPISVTPFTNYQEVIRTEAEKAAIEKDNLTIDDNYTADAEVQLPLTGANYTNVSISWTSNNTDAITIAADGKATITVPDLKTEVTLTATLKCGDTTLTKEFTVTLNKTPLTAGQAVEIGKTMEHNTYTEGKYLIAGVITEIYNTEYGNMKITDNEGNILTVYGTYDATDEGETRFDDMATKPAVGDYVVLLGVIGQYNNAPQTKNAWIVSWISPTSISDANAIGSAKDHNTYTEEEYLITGTITEVANTTYGNLYIEDEDGNKIYVYGLYDQLNNRYDSMNLKPVAGDTVTILSVLGQYNNTVQAKDATLVGYTPKNTDPEPDSILTVEEAIALGASKAHNTFTSGKYYVTGEITEIYDTTYGNMKIKDSAGNIITIYGTYDATGATRFDAMQVQPAVGDTITVYGVIGQYNDTPQIKNGWITEQ